MALFYSTPGLAIQMKDETTLHPDPLFSDSFSTPAPPIDSYTLAITTAVERLKQGRFQRAFDYAKASLTKVPDSIPGHGIIGVVLALTGQNEPAQKELEFLISNDKNHFYSELINAILKAQNGDLITADEHLTASLKTMPDHPVALYYRGSLFLASKQYTAAIKTFETVIQSQPEFVPALAGLGQAFLELREMGKAADYYERAVKLEPENLLYRRQLLSVYKETGKQELINSQTKEMLYYMPGVKQEYIKKGHELLVLGAYEDAAALMDKILAVYKELPLAFYIKAAAYTNLNQRDRAVDNIEKFLDVQKNSPLAHHYSGMCYMALEMYKKAEGEFIKVISMNPNMGKSFVPLTIIEQVNGNFIRALEGLNLAEKNGEPAALVSFFSAHIFLQLKNDRAFLERMETGGKLIPGLKDYSTWSLPDDNNRDFIAENRNLMVLFFYNSWYDKSLRISQALLEKNSKDRLALYYKALCETAQNKNSDGIQTFNALLKLEKKMFSAHMGLGQLYLKTNDLKNAEIAFKNVINLNPSYAPAYEALGDVCQRDNHRELAIHNYQKALEINPQAVTLYSKLIILLSEEKEALSQAAQYAEKLETFSPEDPYSLDALGWINLILNKKEKGLELIQRAHKALPQDPLILYHLGIACYESNDLKTAERYLQTALDQSNNFPGHDHAMDILKEIKSHALLDLINKP